MKFSNVCRPWFGLAALAGLLMGCGSSNPEGDLPPQTPAVESDIEAAEQQIKDNMGGMGPTAN